MFVLPELLILLSLLIAGIEDVKDRAVHDVVWIPAIAGAALMWMFNPSFAVLGAADLVLMGGVAALFLKMGSVAQGDAIALVLLAADPMPGLLFVALGGAGAVAVVHAVVLYRRGGLKVMPIPLSVFKAQQQWIPVALLDGDARTEVDQGAEHARDWVEKEGKDGSAVEVKYGSPTVAYFAVGYTVALFAFFLSAAGGILI